MIDHIIMFKATIFFQYWNAISLLTVKIDLTHRSMQRPEANMYTTRQNL